MIIRSNRVRLAFQATAIVLIAVALGYGLQQWQVVERSTLGNLDSRVPGPLVMMVVGGVGLFLAATLARDGWNHRLVLADDAMDLITRRGRVRIPYAEVAAAVKLSRYGVGIRLRDFEAWIAEQPEAPESMGREAEVLRSAYGVDIGILGKNLHVGADRTLAFIQDRLPVADGPGADAEE